MKRRIDADEAFDITILSPAMIDDLVKLGKIATDSRVDLGRQGISLGVRTGMAKPDISSVEAFKRTMLNATPVAYFKEGTAGRHFLSVLDRLGITTDMTSKLKAYDTTGVVQALAKDEAVRFCRGGDWVLVTIRGVEIVGGFSEELQQYITYTIGVSAPPNIPKRRDRRLGFLSLRRPHR